MNTCTSGPTRRKLHLHLGALIPQALLKPGGRRQIWEGCGLAVFGTVLAVLIHEELVYALGQQIPPFLVFYPVVMASAVWGGSGCGLLASVLVTAAADYYAFEPKYRFTTASSVELVSLLLFLAINVMISMGGGALRQARVELQRKVENLSEILQLLDLSCSFVIDPDFRIIRWGSGCRRLYGYTAQQALGNRSCELLKTRFPEPVAQIREKLLATNRWEGELGHTTAEGREIIVRTEWQTWFDSKGTFSAILEHNTDITAEKQAESARTNLLAIIEGSHDPIVGYTLDGTIMSWNPAAERVYGYAAQEMIGHNIRKLVPEDRIPEEQMVVAAIESGEPVENFESKRLTKDGEEIDVAITVSPIYAAGGGLIGISKIAHDITQRKAAEEERQNLSIQLAESNRALEAKVQERTARLEQTLTEMEEFSYSITHDLRAPLRAMRGYISLLLEEKHSPSADPASRYQDYLMKISNAAERMDHLVVDALDFSKALRGELPVKAVDADALVRRMIEFDPAFHLPQADIAIEGRIPMVLANHAALTQCFSNLLGNAVKFTREGALPQVRIRTEWRNRFVRIWVVDHGIGIAKEHLSRIWTMFQVVDKSRGGTGTGLALTRKVVERMGGRTGVESELGIGSRFWVELPPAFE